MIYPQHEIPLFNEGDWVEVTARCNVGQYIGRIIQVVNVYEPNSVYGRYEYECNVTDNMKNVFWEHELTLAKVIPVDKEFFEKKEKEKEEETVCNDDCDKPSETADNTEEEKEDKTIWV